MYTFQKTGLFEVYNYKTLKLEQSEKHPFEKHEHYDALFMEGSIFGSTLYLAMCKMHSTKFIGGCLSIYDLPTKKYDNHYLKEKPILCLANVDNNNILVATTEKNLILYSI